jgi:hypothetical protein
MGEISSILLTSISFFGLLAFIHARPTKKGRTLRTPQAIFDRRVARKCFYLPGKLCPFMYRSHCRVPNCSQLFLPAYEYKETAQSRLSLNDRPLDQIPAESCRHRHCFLLGPLH